MSTRIYHEWMRRVGEPTIGEGHIRQLKDTIWPLADGYPPGGHKTALTESEASNIRALLEARIERGDAPRVTDEQADKGRQWIERYGRKLGIPEDYRTGITHFTLIDFDLLADNGWRAYFGPKYRAHYEDGRSLDYVATAWTSRVGASFEFTIHEGAAA